MNKEKNHGVEYNIIMYLDCISRESFVVAIEVAIFTLHASMMVLDKDIKNDS